MYLVNYKTNIITGGESIEADGFSTIYFENIGEATAMLNGVIPLTHQRCFENDPEQIINDKFGISFTGASNDKRVLVIKTYYQKS